MEGIILEAESGDYLGKHRGFWFYTIGQRQGLRLPGGPWYVPSFDAFSTISCPVIIIVSPYCLLLQWGKVFPSSYKYVCFIRPETHLTKGLSYLVQVRCRERCSKQCGFCIKELLFIG